MTEQLIADLARIGGLRVISRTSVMQYRTARKPVPTIVRELQVDAIIEGSVVRAGDSVRITAKLIRGAHGRSHLGAELRARPARRAGLAARGGANHHQRSRHHADAAGAGAPGRAPGRSIRRSIGRFSSAAITSPKPRRKACGKPFSISTSRSRRIPATRMAHAGLAEAYTGLSGFYVHPREVDAESEAGRRNRDCASMSRSPTRTRRSGSSISCTTGTDQRRRRRSCARSISIRRWHQPV